jgi:hypothetical protein
VSANDSCKRSRCDSSVDNRRFVKIFGAVVRPRTVGGGSCSPLLPVSGVLVLLSRVVYLANRLAASPAYRFACADARMLTCPHASRRAGLPARPCALLPVYRRACLIVDHECDQDRREGDELMLERGF